MHAMQEETKPALPPHLQAAIKNTPGAAGGNKGELSWLMRTTYISNDTADRRQQGQCCYGASMWCIHSIHPAVDG